MVGSSKWSTGFIMTTMIVILLGLLTYGVKGEDPILAQKTDTSDHRWARKLGGMLGGWGGWGGMGVGGGAGGGWGWDYGSGGHHGGGNGGGGGCCNGGYNGGHGGGGGNGGYNGGNGGYNGGNGGGNGGYNGGSWGGGGGGGGGGGWGGYGGWMPAGQPYQCTPQIECQSCQAFKLSWHNDHFQILTENGIHPVAAFSFQLHKQEAASALPPQSSGGDPAA